MVDDIKCEVCSGRRVMIVSGFFKQNNMSESLAKIARCGNAVVACEPTANICDKSFISNIEPTLCAIKDNDGALPEVLITIGGGLTSGVFKEWLRKLPHIKHYCIKTTDYSVDCYGQAVHHVRCDAERLLSDVAECMPSDKAMPSAFKTLWAEASRKAKLHVEEYCDAATWSALKAMRQIIERLPDEVNLQLSNGMAVRYAGMLDCGGFASVNCNRGVSGIDGSASTAVGFNSVSNAPTVLITGDMSMQYDVGALSLRFFDDNFKIIVLNNGGGGIFKYIKATRDISTGYKWYDEPMNLPLRQLADAYGYAYYRAETSEQLAAKFDEFMAGGKSILDVATNAAADAQILRNLFKN
jgi:2-succinyl-5-enolpyruvyl-6-hydroxy-3-cyclohexene-1-carboxylate synthase